MAGKKILVVYFSQTGQLRRILDSVLRPLQTAGGGIEWLELKPVPPFPMPWTSDQFFDAFPETFMGIPCALDPFTSELSRDHDLVILGYSPWYLSPSIPVASFLQSPEARLLLEGKPVVTVIGCRNMWLMSQEKIKKYLASLKSRLVGNIVLWDKAGNLTSVLTVIRWLIKGQQEASRFLPRAGVSEKDIEHAQVFGECIVEALGQLNFEPLQQDLQSRGAFRVFPDLAFFERNGSKIFKMWASRILKKGPYGDPRRKASHRAFKWYLLFVLFVISPVGNLVFKMLRPFRKAKVNEDLQYFSQTSLSENN